MNLVFRYRERPEVRGAGSAGYTCQSFLSKCRLSGVPDGACEGTGPGSV